MSKVAKDTGGGNFTPAPQGQFQGVCVDVVDLGVVTRDYGGKKKARHLIQIYFQLLIKDDSGKEIRTENGHRFSVRTKEYGFNLSEKGHLRPFIESWRGRKFTTDEKEFDLDVLIGANALLQIVHNESKGNTYANIQTIMPWQSAWGPKIEPENYTRKEDRDKQVS